MLKSILSILLITFCVTRGNCVYLIFFFHLIYFNSIISQVYTQTTVQTILNNAGCSTYPVGGLAAQLVTKMNQIKPGFMTSYVWIYVWEAKSVNILKFRISGQTRITLFDAASAVPFAQTSTLNALKNAVASRAGVTLSNFLYLLYP